MELNFKTIGASLVAFGVILLFILTLVKVNVDKEGAFLCQIVDESEDLTMDQCPAHDNYNSWLILVAFGIAFLIIVSGIYMLFFPPKKVVLKESQDRKEVDPTTLDEEERNIYNLLLLKEGSAYQSDLIKEIGMTKVKMSRVLDRLEGKHVLERKRRGMTNIVVLK